MKVISKQEAKKKRLLYYFTGNPCVHGHVSPRLVSTGKCQECVRQYHTQYIKTWQKENKDKVNKASRRYRASGTLSTKATHKKYYEANKERKLQQSKEWRARNHYKVVFYNVMRRKGIKQATPSWADTEQIKEVYKQAEALAEQTGTTYHVDHIIPLKGKNVCGLHAADNLRAIPGKENMEKGNKFLTS